MIPNTLLAIAPGGSILYDCGVSPPGNGQFTDLMGSLFSDSVHNNQSTFEGQS